MNYPVPAAHSVGDIGHTTDHDSIIQVLSTLVGNIQALQGITQNLFHTGGPNSCVITGTATSWAQVDLPGGSRDSAADTFDVFYGAAKVFSLNGYGEIRLFPGGASHVPAIVQGLPSQTGDLLQFRNSSGQVIARVSPSGALTTGPVSAYVGGAPETWHPASLTSGWANSTIGPAAQYRLLSSPPATAEIIGDISGGTRADGTMIFSLPPAYQPNSSQLVSGGLLVPGSPSLANARLFCTSAGLVQVDGISSLASPGRVAFHGLISLDA
jgi:hypothetical protein